MFFLTQRRRDAEVLGDGTARVYLTTEYTEHTERHGMIFMKFHVFHGSGLFNAETQRCGTGILPVFHGRNAHALGALLGCFTRRREDAKEVGGRVSPRAAFRCAEGREGRASLVRGQADACPSLRFAKRWRAVAGWLAIVRVKQTIN